MVMVGSNCVSFIIHHPQKMMDVVLAGLFEYYLKKAEI